MTDHDHGHVWVAASTVPIRDDRGARSAVRHRRLTIGEAMTVQVLEVLCASCRLSYERAQDGPCDPLGEHLHGGKPDGQRVSRRVRAVTTG